MQNTNQIKGIFSSQVMYESATNLDGIIVFNGNINLNKAYISDYGGWGVAITMNIDDVLYIQLFFSSVIVATRKKELSSNSWSSWSTH